MTWAPLLLADPSPLLRLRVLRDLLGRPADDAEVRELTELSAVGPAGTTPAGRPAARWLLAAGAAG